MTKFLVIHTRYKDVQIGLFNNNKLIDVTADDNKKISKNFLYLTNELLLKNNINLCELNFIAAHQGPAPFTTLRVSLASVNGLAFATHIPLVGVSGLKTFLNEYKSNVNLTVALLNAFCKEIYYGIFDPETQEISIGYAPAQEFIKNIADIFNGNITFIGNGVDLYREFVYQYLDNRAIILDPLPEMVSLKALGEEAFIEWQNNKCVEQIMPLYLKDSSAIICK